MVHGFFNVHFLDKCEVTNLRKYNLKNIFVLWMLKNSRNAVIQLHCI